MSVQIGQASIDERGKIAGGAAGNQSGKELNIRSYYKSNWQYVLRCKDSFKALAMASECMKACKNPYIGYDQSQRNTLRTQAKAYGYDLGAITMPCECDCSSLMAVIAECVGISVYTSANAPTTATMLTAFKNTGFFDVLTDSKYLTSDTYLKTGDILLKAGHTVMVLGNGGGSGKATAKGYTVGKTYTTQVELNVRASAGGTKLKYDALTLDGKKNARFDEFGNAILLKGTRVTCKAVTEVNGYTWLKIPSGWICAKTTDKTYIL